MASPKPQDGLYANRGYRVLVANVVLALLATLAVVLRIAARRLNKVALGAYDIAIIIALVRTIPQDRGTSVLMFNSLFLSCSA